MDISTNPSVVDQSTTPPTGPTFQALASFIAAVDAARGEQVREDFDGVEVPPGDVPVVTPPVVGAPPVETPAANAEVALRTDNGDAALQFAADLFATLPPGSSVWVVRDTEVGSNAFTVVQGDGPLSLDGAALVAGTDAVLGIASFGEAIPSETGVGRGQAIIDLFPPSTRGENAVPSRD
ncbi:hypothetical protein [Salinarimonas ramus]|uniref:Uncharacterized protein n=1 Tax=Salinarimonas ramus TaxID=690164 RepID=A0A917V4A6_9HYPH|nr:hypothetical protein [Salinarimonas ramus]GGK35608.1 hypothetical protein GCM10011322_23090 [Salinarimonas ramus]